jgi:tetratricopeptide (TPR) repeat protein
MAISRSRVVLIVAAGLLPAAALSFQFGVFRNLGYTPQAKTQQEYDLFLEIVEEEMDVQRIEKVDLFVDAYPRSELLGQAYQFQLSSYRSTNNFEGVLQAGDKVLSLLPDNLEALVTLAEAIPNGTAGREDGAQLIERAEQYALKALDVVDRTNIPREIPYSEWERYRFSLEARAHGALGHIAAKRGDLGTAVAEFETALRLNPEPAGTQHFRLGVAYVWIGRTEDAKKALSRAAELGPSRIRDLALRELNDLEKRGAK